MRSRPFVLSVALSVFFLLDGCVPIGSLAVPKPIGEEMEPGADVLPPISGAFQSGQYRNLFKEMLGKDEVEISAKIDAAWDQLFYGDDSTERVYYPVGSDMAYIEDIGNGDVRTEGMSYAMMIAVQLDKKEEFDRLWRWTQAHMYQEAGPYRGYFAWHCKPNGDQIHGNPASDGEEWFATALLFAAGRWGDSIGAIDYRAEAQGILHTMLHKHEEDSDLATDMFDPGTRQVVFVPTLGRNSGFTDPSYQLPAYYELWSLWADTDNEFWAQAAQVSRAFFKKAAHPRTGLMPDYATFDGVPTGGEHEDFRFDAFRAAANVAVDYAWFAADPWEVEQTDRLLDFFHAQGMESYGNQFALDGKQLSAQRSTGLVAMNAVAALASESEYAPEFVGALWDASIPSGKWRYYDGLLYMLALLHVSGNFRIYPPQGF